MGGIPEHALITILCHPSRPFSLLEGIYKGMGELARRFDISLAGGETSALPYDGLVINVALTGRVERGMAILRSGGAPGDQLFVTGVLGGSFPTGWHLDFEPRVKLARALLKAGIRPSAMMDLSDGLGTDLPRLAAASGCGFEIDEQAEEDDADFEDVLSIMYMFREDKLVAKMYVQYVMDADIDLILKQFSGTGLYVCVRTFDPNIDERMIAHKLNMKRMPLKIVRYASAEEVTAYEEKVDSGLVTCGSPKSLLQVISYCEKVLRTRKTNIALSVLSVLIGAAILALLLLSDSMGLLNSLYIAVYQMIWMIPLAISSKMFIR
jgi:hypothetical protein